MQLKLLRQLKYNDIVFDLLGTKLKMFLNGNENLKKPTPIKPRSEINTVFYENVSEKMEVLLEPTKQTINSQTLKDNSQHEKKLLPTIMPRPSSQYEVCLKTVEMIQNQPNIKISLLNNNVVIPIVMKQVSDNSSN